MTSNLEQKKKKAADQRLYKLKIKPWKRTLYYIRERCLNKNNPYCQKGIKVLITEKELKELWFRDKGYLLVKPSIDRIDSKGHYEKSNCRYIELTENARGCTPINKIVVDMFDMNMRRIKTFSSCVEASKEVPCHSTNISQCALGKRRTAGGFIWKRSEL